MKGAGAGHETHNNIIIALNLEVRGREKYQDRVGVLNLIF